MSYNAPFGDGPPSPLSPETQSKPKKPVDAKLVAYLVDYAASPECPPQFKSFLENVILQGTESDRIKQADYYLRNPDVRQFGFTEDFSLVISEYDIWNTWTTLPSNNTVAYGDIPDEYRPSGLSQDPAFGVPATPKSMAKEPEPGRAGSAPLPRTPENAVTSKARELKRWRQTPTPGREGEVEEERPPKRRRSSASAARPNREDDSPGADMEHLLEIFKRLRSIPSGSFASDGAARAETARAGMSDMADRTGPDWTEDSFYKGTRQPPLAVRLQNAITFLADEDVDRDARWNPKFAELCDYLSWLAHDDEAYQLGKASRRTRAMYDEAVDMAKTHILFEKHHYEPTPLDSQPFTIQPTGLEGAGLFNPIKSTRLDWTGVVHDWPTPSPAPPPRRNDLPTRLYPREPIRINPIAAKDKKIRERFVRHTKSYWERDDQNISNLAHIEGAAFYKFVKLGPLKTIKYDTETGQTQLPDGTLVTPGNPVDWAREQGARRAGLQNLLRDFENKEHRSLPDTRCQRVVLPTPAAKVLAVRERAAGPQWQPVALKESEVPQPAETHSYTFFFRKFFRHLAKQREAALLEAQGSYSKPGHWVTMPRNVIVGGPYVLRNVDPWTQAKQDLLNKCLTTVKLLEAEGVRASRPLLDEMMDLIKLGMDGGFTDGLPEDVKLAADEWDMDEGGVDGADLVDVPKYVDDQDLKWLRFLATESVNDGTWQGRFDPDQPKEKYKLFLIFARRVKKLLDDRNPHSLFNKHEVVTVEQLLDAANAGYANSAVEKCNFHPYDACAWLDRLRISGHIRFQYNQAHYGLIQRPILQYHPEHRVRFPSPSSAHPRPSYPSDIRPWSAVVGPDNRTRPSPTTPSDPVRNFFLALALRLGTTIHSLRLAAPPNPIPTTDFRAAYDHFRTVSRAHTALARLPSLGALVRRLDTTGRDVPLPAPNPTDPIPAPLLPEPAALLAIRTRLIDEIAANAAMLHPARERVFLPEKGPLQVDLVRDVSWDFASLAVRGPRPRFFSLDRWPATPVAAPEVVVDASQTADPAAEDPTDKRWKRAKLRRYGETGPVVRKEGPAWFPVGDTRAQMRAVERRMTNMVYAAAGVPRRKRGWVERVWARLNPFARVMPLDDEDPERVRGDEPYLPEIDLKNVPRSKERVEEDEKDKDEDEDVEMTSDVQ